MRTDLRAASFSAALAALAALAVLAACSSTGSGSTGPSGTGAALAKVSGDSQSAQYRAAVPNPLIVKVTDASGSPVRAAAAAWAIQLTGEPLSLEATVTNDSGETQIAPVLNGLPGAFTVIAGINNHNVSFSGSSNVALASGLKNLASGLFASCGLSPQGSAYCWGTGVLSQLGNGATGPVTGAVPVSGDQAFSQISVGGYLTCGLRGTATAYCWGQAIYPQMGNGPSNSIGTFPTPTAAGNGMTFSQIAVGQYQTCGISAGATYCWGFGHQGQLGTGDTVTRFVPTAVHVPGGVTFTSLTLGVGVACGLTSAGAAYCWGSNASGQLGTGSSSPSYSDAPVAVTGALTFASVAVSAEGVCGLTASGTAYCWGQGANGNGTSGVEYAPTAVQQNGVTFAQLSANGNVCALTAAGAAYCWGENNGSGQLGSGSFSTTGSTPVAVTGAHTFSTIFVGSLSVCGYTTTHAMYCWGDNKAQELGLAPSADSMYAVPQPIPGLGTP
jgi:alpha-tubulin suppressor-like RCC1 family protein